MLQTIGGCSAFTTELLALRKALELLDDTGLVVGSVESDCSNIV